MRFQRHTRPYDKLSVPDIYLHIKNAAFLTFSVCNR